MNNINIKNIFAKNSLNTNIPEPTNNINNISIDNLFESSTFKISISDDYIIEKIKLNKINEDNKINDFYELKYKECLIKINNAIELNLTDIIFSVNNNYFGYKTYNPTKCLLYIKNKLNSKNFLTFISTKRDIFISWKNITDF